MSSFDQKTLQKVIKEGGKRGVEIQGVAEMGGLEFFCTKLDEPNGNVELLVESMKAMNAEVDPSEEERRGGSGAVGKMIFSINNEKVAVVAYVPKDKADKIDIKDWLLAALTPFDGKVLSVEGDIATGEILANPDKGVFTLKVRDEALPLAIAYLRSKGLFPEADSDSDSDVAFGDDFDFDAC
ncbi:hypothetical protein K493DRAFT_298599 [Basidiobolus meristosporus CBS 931.73]|uniref:Uncharacterized protein n=1 Tax=Basidiobolus meristosporus CBS 931.73 TaxID=1314790 RepID=A0A1Y1YSK8_9FUNG|nr:hypothetical protein K493DRAFT_298599 [Basidiobolus meristosporus CBS 931.73]|eukprot:ORY01023.1 hypothetical protein K493DRAFT_298599 [Basidiobolus meristosporus CBS 931.73]